MSKVETSIEVNVPVRVAYDQWTQFESFPMFMEGVKRVEQLDATRLRWTAEIGGRTKSWLAKITEQQPDRILAWESVDGARNSGIVTFEKLAPDKTRIKLTLEYEPEGPIESAGDVLGVVDRTVRGDLKRFKEFIEARGKETGAWRGQVSDGKVKTPPPKTAAAKTAAAKSAPAKSAPAKSAPAKSAPAKSAPARTAPAKSRAAAAGKTATNRTSSRGSAAETSTTSKSR
jgi:hypothetical protein